MTVKFDELGYATPILMRFDSAGNLVWNRVYDMAPGEDIYLKDIVPSVEGDGGWVLSGFNFSAQSSWIMKVDSLGYTCTPLDCDSTVVVIGSPTVPLPQEAGVAPFELLPNPATETTQIVLKAPPRRTPHAYTPKTDNCYKPFLSMAPQTVSLLPTCLRASTISDWIIRA